MAESFTVTEAAMRPAGRGQRQCFYCSQAIGEPHLYDCVLVQRIWTVTVSFDLTIGRPAFWNADTLDFALNGSSWCADNIASDLNNHLGREDHCLCSSFEATALRPTEIVWLSEADEPPPPPQACEQSQPVAWRWRYVCDGIENPWTISTHEVTAREPGDGHIGVEVQPLYLRQGGDHG